MKKTTVFAALATVIPLLLTPTVLVTISWAGVVSNVLYPLWEDPLEGLEAVVIGRVRKVQGKLVEEPGGVKYVETEVVLVPERILYGPQQKTFSFRVPGGTVGNVVTIANHVPDFRKGKRVLVLISNCGEKLCVSGSSGKYNLIRDKRKGEIAIDSDGKRLPLESVLRDLGL